MRPISFLFVSLFLCLTSSFAQESPRTVEDLVQWARMAIEDADFEKARGFLDEAETLAPTSSIPVTREGLRNISFYPQ